MTPTPRHPTLPVSASGPARRARRRRAALRAAARASVALLFLAVPVHAQRTTLTVGQTVSGTLDGLDPTLTSGVRFELFEFEGRAGERVTATLSSLDFDAVLRLARTVAGITDELEMDDDGAGPESTDARIRTTLPVSGSYLLIAQSYGEGEGGAFTLSLQATPEPTTATPQPLVIGQTVDAVLAETDAVDDEDDSYFDVWTIQARAGQWLVALMEAETLDAYLQFGRLDADGRFEELEFDDDGGGGTDARLRVRVPNTGTYELRATAVGVETGPYRLTLAEGAAPAETASRQSVRAGEPVDGELTDTDAVREDGQHHDYWLYEGLSGERLLLRLMSDAFDAHIAFGRLDGNTFIEIAANDDGPDGTDSELDVTIAANGTYAIRASSLGEGETGGYRVQVTRR